MIVAVIMVSKWVLKTTRQIKTILILYLEYNPVIELYLKYRHLGYCTTINELGSQNSLWHLGIKYKVKLSCSSELIEITTKILLVTAV
jgi:hypothetical protein